jgi:anti-sigma factor RsiW
MSWVRKRNEKTEHGYVEERLSAYLDGELTQQEQGIVESHLAACQDCRWNLDTLRQTVQWVQELPSVPVPRVFTIPVPAQPARAPRRRWGVPLLQGATALVALMLVFVVAGDFVLTGSWLPAAREVGLPLAAPGGREAAPTVAAEPDAALQAVVETPEVEVTKQVELEMETVVEEAAVEEVAPAATVLESPAPEAAVPESPPPEPAELPAPAAAPSIISERVLEAKATLEAPAGEGTAIAEAQTVVAKAEEVQTATPVPEPTVLPTETGAPPPLPTPTAIPTEEPLAVEAPTAVSIAPAEEPQAEGQEGVRAEDWVEPAPVAAYDEAEAARLPRDPLIVWFGVAEISLAAVFVLLATITIVVMIRQRRTR